MTGLQSDLSRTRAFTPEASRETDRPCLPHSNIAPRTPCVPSVAGVILTPWTHRLHRSAPSFRRALAAGVVALVTWVAWPADAGAATEPDPGLVGQVPSALASTCEWASVDGIANAEAAVICTPPASIGRHRRHVSPLPERRDRGLVLRGRQGRGLGSRRDCADLGDSESPYHTSSGRQGRLACSTAHHQSTLTWTDDAVVATATGKNDERLYAWWDKLVGRTLTEAQQRAPDRAPGGDPALGLSRRRRGVAEVLRAVQVRGRRVRPLLHEVRRRGSHERGVRRGPGRQRTRARPRRTEQLRDGLQLRDVLGTRTAIVRSPTHADESRATRSPPPTTWCGPATTSGC